jgi:hypothetical protein
MEPNESPGAKPPLDGLPPEAEGNELRPRDDAVLSAGQRRERRLPFVSSRPWSLVCTICVTLGGHGAIVAGGARRVWLSL